MRRFHWTPGNTVFQPEFDAEHRELFRLGDELQRAVQARAEPRAIDEAIRRLAAEVESHFAHEERLMRSSGYSAYEWHKRQHDSARQRIQSLAGEPGELLRYLAGWFRDHTGVADRMMTASLRNASRVREMAAS